MTDITNFYDIPEDRSADQGFCHCCGKKVTLLTDQQLGESICAVCHSYDVTRNKRPVSTLHVSRQRL
jgi:hypothetical protein